MTNKAYLHSLRTPTADEPLRILVSSCLMGTLCGADGSSYGSYPHVITLANYPNVAITSFCPEHFAFGTPRAIPDIQGGNGADVLAGKATVITETGEDITKGMLKAADKMLEIARHNQIELAVMMDVSAACGSQVIYKGHRLAPNPHYQIGMGVCAALLTQNGFPIISQRDFRSWDILLAKIDTSHTPDPSAIDHDETGWYRQYFGK